MENTYEKNADAKHFWETRLTKTLLNKKTSEHKKQKLWKTLLAEKTLMSKNTYGKTTYENKTHGKTRMKTLMKNTSEKALMNNTAGKKLLEKHFRKTLLEKSNTSGTKTILKTLRTKQFFFLKKTLLGNHV